MLVQARTSYPSDPTNEWIAGRQYICIEGGAVLRPPQGGGHRRPVLPLFRPCSAQEVLEARRVRGALQRDEELAVLRRVPRHGQGAHHAGRYIGRPSGPGTGPGGPLARPAAAGGELPPHRRSASSAGGRPSGVRCPRCRVQHRDLRGDEGAGGGFRCCCTGVVLADPWSPWSLMFDHAVPGDAKTLVVAAWWGNEDRLI